MCKRKILFLLGYFVLISNVVAYVPTGSSMPNNTLQPPNTRFGLANFCPESVFFVFRENESDSTGTLPQNVVLAPGYEYSVPLNSNESYISFNALPKILCDENGNDCVIGDESATVPGHVPQPTISTFFEATFDANGVATSYDVSDVNGTTIPAVAVAFQGPNETYGTCTDSDAGNIPYPPVLLNPNSQDYSSKLAAFESFCQSGSGESNSFLTPFIYSANNLDFFVGTARDPILESFTPVIQNPYFINESNKIAERGGNPNSIIIGCASPGQRLVTISNNVATESFAADGMGAFHTQDFESPPSSNKYDSNVIMLACPFGAGDVDNVKNMVGLEQYLVAYDSQQPHSDQLASSPWVQLVESYEAGAESQIFTASLICKNGPMNTNYWTTTIHNITNYVYAYSYDDSVGGRGCNDPNTKIVYVTCGQFNQGY